MSDTAILWIANGGAMVSIALLRLSWALPQRSTAQNSIGWGLLIISLFLGGWAYGAWGVSIVSLSAMTMAMLLLCHAAITAPIPKQGAQKPAKPRAAPLAAPRAIPRRLMTFFIILIPALIASLLISTAGRQLMIWANTGDANANVTAYFLMPLIWAILSYALLMKSRRREQWAMLAIVSIIGLVPTIAGSIT